MARTAMHVDANPEAVFKVLADGERYADWVVGATKVRSAAPAFPAPGSALQPTVGIRLFGLPARTEVIDVDPPECLVLDARVGGFHVQIRFRLAPDGSGTSVTMDEQGVGTFSRRIMAMAKPFVLARNAETLWRLRAQVLNDQDVSLPTPTGASSTVAVPRWLGDTTARLFGLVAAARDNRALHPRGVTCRARARLTSEGAALASARHLPAVVRFSRGAGLGDRLPDINGLAIRLVDAAGSDLHRDLLFSSAGPGIFRQILVPSVDFGSSRFSSVLRFRWTGQPVTLVASVDPTGLTLSELRAGSSARIVTSAIGSDGSRSTLAEITIDGVLEDSRVRFSPGQPDDVLVPIGFLNALRVPAYAASQAVLRLSSPKSRNASADGDQ
jgi:uncharacterized protein YndB with AHSA1/START domain